jgi:hypothetical protein
LIAWERSFIEDKVLRKEAISRELELGIILEEVSWKQMSRALWLRDGDNNTDFFRCLVLNHHLSQKFKLEFQNLNWNI